MNDHLLTFRLFPNMPLGGLCHQSEHEYHLSPLIPFPILHTSAGSLISSWLMLCPGWKLSQRFAYKKKKPLLLTLYTSLSSRLVCSCLVTPFSPVTLNSSELPPVFSSASSLLLELQARRYWNVDWNVDRRYWNVISDCRVIDVCSLSEINDASEKMINNISSVYQSETASLVLKQMNW